MANRWYRAYEGTVSDPKLGEVAIIAECSRSVVIAAWHAILENAACLNDGGRFDAPARRVAAALGEPVKVIGEVFAGLEEVGLTAEGCIVAWQRRQFESDSSTERSRKHREKQCNADATLQEQPETPVHRPHRQRTETEKKDISSESGFETDFQAFYEAYPKHEGRGQAIKAYRAARKKVEAAVLLKAAQRFRARRSGEDAKFTPLPASWLNGERWADDPGAGHVPSVTPRPAYIETHADGWRERLRRFQKSAVWSSSWGPKPGEPGCKCPPEILSEKEAA